MIGLLAGFRTWGLASRTVMVLGLLIIPLSLWSAEADPSDEALSGTTLIVAEATAQAGSRSADSGQTPSSDEYGNVTEEEAATAAEGKPISDPIEPFNRAMYHFNDKLYFWALEPAARGYKYVVPEGIRGVVGSFYQNVKAPVRIVNNLLQRKPKYAAIEALRFLINSTVGVGGLRDCAKECFDIEGREADFGQTLGVYGLGTGFYVVWPFVGPSSARDSVGWLADRALMPTTYVSSSFPSWEGIGLFAHDAVNKTSFHLGDYEALKDAAVDPYVAMRDAYRQYRQKKIAE
jgi:phospholipid-binding lipoprotein MlaA